MYRSSKAYIQLKENEENNRAKLRQKQARPVQEFNYSEGLRNQVYQNLSMAVIKQAIEEKDYFFFSEENPWRDIYIGLAKIPIDILISMLEKFTVKITSSVKKDYIPDSVLDCYFDGNLTIKEIEKLTGLSQGTLYSRCKEKPEWKYMCIKGAQSEFKCRPDVMKLYKRIVNDE